MSVIWELFGNRAAHTHTQIASLNENPKHFRIKVSCENRESISSKLISTRNFPLCLHNTITPFTPFTPAQHTHSATLTMLYSRFRNIAVRM